MDTGSLTSGSYHASCASDVQESTFLKRARLLRWVQIGLAIVVFAISVSATGCESVLLQHYRRTSAFEYLGLYLWPLNLDLRPNIALLACGCVSALLTLIHLVIALIPSPHSRIRRSNFAATATATAGFIATLVGALFAIYRPGSNPPSGFSTDETLHSWTCKWRSIRAESNSDNTLPSAPAHFARDCAVAEAGFALVCALIGLYSILGVAAGVGIWLGRGVSRQREEEQLQLDKIQIMAKHPGR
ncbi:hypothetical protein BDV59DRAFT_176897 [Aspergillus ambiguus]|uniref:uncharacterized protein n=1 Tax=Aspergillus ambiguus TaxID=176160 RepID=UPI003CCCD7D5